MSVFTCAPLQIEFQEALEFSRSVLETHENWRAAVWKGYFNVTETVEFQTDNLVVD